MLGHGENEVVRIVGYIMRKMVVLSLESMGPSYGLRIYLSFVSLLVNNMQFSKEKKSLSILSW